MTCTMIFFSIKILWQRTDNMLLVTSHLSWTRVILRLLDYIVFVSLIGPSMSRFRLIRKKQKQSMFTLFTFLSLPIFDIINFRYVLVLPKLLSIELLRVEAFDFYKIWYDSSDKNMFILLSYQNLVILKFGRVKNDDKVIKHAMTTCSCKVGNRNVVFFFKRKCQSIRSKCRCVATGPSQRFGPTSWITGRIFHAK